MQKWMGALLVGCSLAVSAVASENLKAFYEAQKAEMISQFTPPALGGWVRVKTAAGVDREGTLYRLSSDSLVLLTDRGEMTYRREALDESSRVQFFAEDFAHAKALERTRDKKRQIESDAAASNVVSIQVRGKIERESDSSKQYKGDMESKTKTKSELYRLEVALSSKSKTEERLELVWIFIGQSITTDGKGAETVLDSGKQWVTLPSAGRVQQALQSKQITLTESQKEVRDGKEGQYSTNIEESVSGGEYTGYVVGLRRGTVWLDRKASDRKYLDPQWIDRL